MLESVAGYQSISSMFYAFGISFIPLRLLKIWPNISQIMPENSFCVLEINLNDPEDLIILKASMSSYLLTYTFLLVLSSSKIILLDGIISLSPHLLFQWKNCYAPGIRWSCSWFCFSSCSNNVPTGLSTRERTGLLSLGVPARLPPSARPLRFLYPATPLALSVSLRQYMAESDTWTVDFVIGEFLSLIFLAPKFLLFSIVSFWRNCRALLGYWTYQKRVGTVWMCICNS